MVSPLKRKPLRFYKRITLVIFLLLCSWIFACSCYAQGPGDIRVAIMQDVSSLRLRINGRYEIVDSANNASLSKGKYLNTTVTAFKGGILLGRIKAKTPRLLIKPGALAEVIINGRKFRGNMQFIKKDSRLLVVNYVGIDDYVKGILYHEVSHYWPHEVLKAQAVVSRTYAVYQMRKNKLKDYDVTGDIYSQVYGGKTSERYRTNRAVAETRREILTFKGEVFPAYFHASCGGHTEDSSVLWNIDTPPLAGVTCGKCGASPHFRWHRVLTLRAIAQKLKEAGYSIKGIQDIRVLGRDKSGRVVNLEISSNNKDTKITAKDFRQTIGPNVIRSTNFKVGVVENDAVFSGLGWGHGVGFCQWGAYFMAKGGEGYETILKYYYPGSKISRVDIY